VQRVLVVDDDPTQLDVVTFLLRRAAFEPVTAADPAAAIRLFDELDPDLVILDVRLGDASGLDLLRRFREQRSAVPILMLTAAKEEDDRVRGLELGADDYLPKPFGHQELIARVRAMLRRGAIRTTAPRPAARVQVGSLVLDPMRHEVTRDGRHVDVTPTEFRLLHCLMARPDEVVPARTLLREVWGHQDLTARNVLRVTAGRLRAKLEDDPAHPRLLQTVAGQGLLLRSEGTADMQPVPQTRPPSQTHDEDGPIALDTIAELRELHADAGGRALRHLVGMFEEAAVPRVTAMREALARRDRGALERQAHTLRGSAVIVGARRVARVCAEIETASRAGDLVSIVGLLDQVQIELTEFSIAIRDVLPDAWPDRD
jgi:DNA-binding response OmpR family regulator/HPt (histidine-containing phosphotransfer) domain-containing protein